MPTKKHRHNIIIEDDLVVQMREIADRYQMPLSMAIIFLCVRGMEYERRFQQTELLATAGMKESRGNREVPVFRSQPRHDPLPKAVHDD